MRHLRISETMLISLGLLLKFDVNDVYNASTDPALYESQTTMKLI